MRSPSARVLQNTVTAYRYLGGQTTDAGLKSNSYGTTPIASGVACSVQPDDPERMYDDAGRIVREIRTYSIMFGSNPGLQANDKVTWTDTLGVSHDLFVLGTADQAGRGAAFVVSCEERR
jgi:hypothetical protein